MLTSSPFYTSQLCSTNLIFQDSTYRYINLSPYSLGMTLIIKDFNLKHTLESGQFFRYSLHEGWYYIITRDKVFRAKQEGNKLHYEGSSEAFVKQFFGLNDNYTIIKRKLHKDPILALAMKKYSGMRIIHQDPWECTVSFLCSSATNIPRIKRDLNNIAQTFGRQKNEFFIFPRVGEIDSLQKLRKCGTGFRAKYIYAINNTVTPSFFKKLKKKPYHKAKASLMELPGIGSKIADCILLFSLDHLNAFPIDVWIEKALKENYTKNKKVNNKQLLSFAQDHFKPYAGYAQQFLYHWRRSL